MLAILFPVVVSAQNVSITGKVLDESGSPLIHGFRGRIPDIGSPEFQHSLLLHGLCDSYSPGREEDGR